MSDGNKVDLTAFSQARPTYPFALEEMGNVLLDAMQGTLICLDQNHSIVDVSKTIKLDFGFEQAEIIGVPILLLIEDSERDGFSKFLNDSSPTFDVCSVRMITAMSNEFRQVKVHRKRKINADSVDVHSTTTKPNGSVRTILVLTVDDSAYVDINLFDIHKQEFYSKINLMGEILFGDHRVATITGFLPQELISNSIFSFVYQDDRLVKLHALWKCVTTGTSKLQWRFNARNGSMVFLQTEYKLISNHSTNDVIVARNELLSPSQQSQFDDLQSAWRHQCMADIRGNGSTFKILSSNESEPAPGNECRISVPLLNMYFSTSKLQSLSVHGNIFDGSKLSRALTIQDYIQILIDHDKNLDPELVRLIQNISALTGRQKSQSNQNSNSDSTSNERLQVEINGTKKTESESIIRGMLGNPMKTPVERMNGFTNSPFSTPTNFQENQNGTSTNSSNRKLGQINNEPTPIITTIPPSQAKTNAAPLTLESISQQHNDFMKKYKAAKMKLESQLEMARNQDMMNGGQKTDVMKRNTTINKLSQLENIKNKHLSRILELKRQALNTPMINNEEKDLLTSLINCPTHKTTSIEQNQMNHNTSMVFNSNNSFYAQQTPTQIQQHRTPNSVPFDNSLRNSIFDDYLTPPSSNNNNFLPMQNGSPSVHSYMNISFRENQMMTTFPNTVTPNQHHYPSHQGPYPY